MVTSTFWVFLGLGSAIGLFLFVLGVMIYCQRIRERREKLLLREREEKILLSPSFIQATHDKT